MNDLEDVRQSRSPLVELQVEGHHEAQSLQHVWDLAERRSGRIHDVLFIFARKYVFYLDRGEGMGFPAASSLGVDCRLRVLVVL